MEVEVRTPVVPEEVCCAGPEGPVQRADLIEKFTKAYAEGRLEDKLKM